MYATVKITLHCLSKGTCTWIWILKYINIWTIARCFLKKYFSITVKWHRPDLNPTEVSGKKPSALGSKTPCTCSLQSTPCQRPLPRRGDKEGAGMCDTCPVIHACSKQLIWGPGTSLKDVQAPFLIQFWVKRFPFRKSSYSQLWIIDDPAKII